MARILVDGQWYNEVSVQSLYENEVERLFCRECKSLFPEYFVVDFKVLVYSSEYGWGKPDLALIHKSYSHWFVVEIEKSSHPFEGHILDQAKLFSTADYSFVSVDKILEKNGDLDEKKLGQMIKGEPPKIIIVVDASSEDWAKTVKRWNTYICVFQIFRSAMNKHIFRFNGQLPLTVVKDSCMCYFHRTLTRYLILESPAILDVDTNQLVTLSYNDTVSDWKRIDMSNKVFLAPVSSNPLEIRKKYSLTKIDDGYFRINLIE